MRVMKGRVAVMLVGMAAWASACTSDNPPPGTQPLDGTYTGAVTATGTCVPSTITLVFSNGVLTSVDAGTNLSWSSANPNPYCSQQVSAGNGMISCTGQGAEIPCADGGYDASGSTALALTAGATLEGDFTTHIETTTPPTCVASVLCDGSGTVTFQHP
jgi:hypothetical protein